MKDRVRKLLLSDRFFDVDEQAELRKARAIRRTFGDDLAMRVVPASWLAQLGQIPRSDLGAAISIEEAHRRSTAARKKPRIFMCSHRWLRPHLDPRVAHPDDDSHGKAAVLVGFADWYRWHRQQIRLDTDVYFFIDFSCIDQADPDAGTSLLALYVAACHNVVCNETSDYDARAWCRLELFMGFVLSHGGDFPFFIDASFRSAGQRERRESRLLLDPAQGDLTIAADAVAIGTLVQEASERAQRGPPSRRVRFGRTTIRVRSV